MGYLDSSYDALKGYCTSGYTILSEQFNQYYPIIRDGAVKYGKPLVTSIHSKALEYPMTALISANIVLIFLAKKIAAFASALLNKLTFGILPKKLTAPIMGISIIEYRKLWDLQLCRFEFKPGSSSYSSCTDFCRGDDIESNSKSSFN